MKKRKRDENAKEEKVNKKDSGALKRPPCAFLIFMEEFRQTYKESSPDCKSITAITKAGGAKWKSMSESENAPYFSDAQEKKAKYEKAKKEFYRKPTTTESGRSSSEVQDDQEEEASC
ncbi:High mobility group box domain [Dillenia turbinata]|uniref:High mobility group box domain n=1 Tax=Dillenia turbinata TaxID=194707 RepID=A0AAN8UPL8_9MAGN